MSWDRIKATGSGKLSFRFVIEGMPTEWVTNPLMEISTTGDRRRRVGFESSCFGFRELVDLTSAKLDAEGFTARIHDVGGHATREFAALPANTTWLTQDIDSNDTTIHCRYNLGWVVGQTIHVGTECMTVLTLPDSVSATVTRATRDTIPQAHFTTDGENLRAPEITTGKPSCIEGRRVYVYAYGDGDNLAGNGQRVFAGVCATDARLADGLAWEITIDPLTSLLEQSVGGDLEEPVSPRGIHYFHGNAPEVNLTLLASNDPTSAIDEHAFFWVTSAASVDLTYFFEDQQAFCERLNDLIVAATSGWATPFTATGTGPSLQAVPTSDGSWTFQYQTGASARWLIVELRSAVDPWFYTNQSGSYRVNGAPITGSLANNVLYELVPVRDTRGLVGQAPGTGMVPRGVYGAPAGVGVTYPPGVDFFPHLYLGGAINVSDIGAFSSGGFEIEWPEQSSSVGKITTRHNVLSSDTATRSIEVQDYGFEDPSQDVMRIWTPSIMPKIRFSRSFATGSVYDLLDHICSESQESANAGYSPLLIDDDFDLSEMQVNVAEAANGFPFLLNRVYAQSKPLKLSEVLGPELLLLGLVACMDETGRICFRKCRALAPTDSVAGTIDASSQLSSVAWPTWERFQNGTVNDITLKTGWDPKEDKYNGTTFRVRDVAAYSRNKLSRRIEIEPKSYLADGNDESLTHRDIVPIVEPIIGLLGYAYDVVTIPVSLVHYDVLVGDNVRVTSKQLPDSRTGLRGLVDATGIVIGREWHPSEAYGVLTILITLQPIAGYAPTSRITASSNLGGNLYEFTIAAGSQPDGYATIALWNIGDEIEVANTGTASPTVRTGTISALNLGAETFQVTLSGAYPGGVCNVDYAGASDVVDTQQAYAFIANDAGVVEFSSGDEPARVFAP